ncbi:transposase of ISPca12 [Salinisphaera sp. S4-8]
MLAGIATQTGSRLDCLARAARWKQRRVIVVDGTGISMPDTPANQAQWPQSASQKPGCGFPQARICACFCLATGELDPTH